MTELAGIVLGALLRGTFLVYGVAVVSHVVVQVVLAQVHHRRAARSAALEAAADAAEHGAPQADRVPAPSVDVSVPVYAEDPDVLRQCLASIAALEHPGQVEVHVVDDASPNRAALEPVYAEVETWPGWHVHRQDRNAGKRAVQDVAFRAGTGDLFLTVDSDTEIAPDGLRRLAAPLLADPRVGAATGDVRVRNGHESLLAALIGLRYWVAFHQERASHSVFGAVLCCSGPFSVYRRGVLADVWDGYVTQTYRGTPCTYGDDRHLTNLVLSKGFRTLFVEGALAWTQAPTRLRPYLRQQLRWNKSFYRELLWTLTFLPRLPRFMTYEVLTQALLPFLLTLAITTTAVRAVLEGPAVLVRYAAVLAVMAVVHCGYGLARTRDPRFALFVLYGFLHAALLIPVRLRALATLTDNRWGTRAPVTPSPVAPSPRQTCVSTAGSTY